MNKVKYLLILSFMIACKDKSQEYDQTHEPTTSISELSNGEKCFECGSSNSTTIRVNYGLIKIDAVNVNSNVEKSNSTIQNLELSQFKPILVKLDPSPQVIDLVPYIPNIQEFKENLSNNDHLEICVPQSVIPQDFTAFVFKICDGSIENENTCLNQVKAQNGEIIKNGPTKGHVLYNAFIDLEKSSREFIEYNGYLLSE